MEGGQLKELKEREWLEATKAKLSFGYLDWVLLDLEGMKPQDEEAGEEIWKLLAYLKENQGRLKYGSLSGVEGSSQPTNSSAM
jgi:hypothetical protein